MKLSLHNERRKTIYIGKHLQIEIGETSSFEMKLSLLNERRKTIYIYRETLANRDRRNIVIYS